MKSEASVKKQIGSREKLPHITRGSVLDDLGFSRSEALELKVKVEIYHDLLAYIDERKFSQGELGTLLGMHQPDVSNLLNGRVSKFSVGKLIKLAGKLDLGAEVRLTKPKGGKLWSVAGRAKASKSVGVSS